MRILALDVGARRIGMAVTDPLGVTAQGIETLQRNAKRTDFMVLDRVIKKYEIAEIVIGNPLHLSGDEGRQAEKVSAFAEELRTKFSLPVHLWDERLTTAQAQRLLKEAEMSTGKRSAVVDQMSAVLILQSFLDARAASR